MKKTGQENLCRLYLSTHEKYGGGKYKFKRWKHSQNGEILHFCLFL